MRNETNSDVHLIILKRIHGNCCVHWSLVLHKAQEWGVDRAETTRLGHMRDKADTTEPLKETEDVRHLAHSRIRRNVRHKQCR